MRLNRITLFRYQLPFVGRVSLGSRTLLHREGLLIRVDASHGGKTATGWGEAAPLPGFSACTQADVQRNAQQWAATAIGQSVAPSVSAVCDLCLPFPSSCGSFRFGAVTAVLDAAARLKGQSLPHLLEATPRATVSLNALVDANDEMLTEEAQRIRAVGYRAVKLKVGRTTVANDIRRVRHLADAIGSDVALRLDANRAWTYDQALRFAEELSDVPLAYVEEPLATPSQLPEWHTATGCAIALDETARELSPERLFDRFPFVRAIVLKPALTGVCATRRWAEQAAQHETDVVLSSAYESGVGLRMVIALAATLGSHDVPAGLDTYRRIRRDLLSDRLPLHGPCISVDAVFGTDRSVDPRDLHVVARFFS